MPHIAAELGLNGYQKLILWLDKMFVQLPSSSWDKSYLFVSFVQSEYEFVITIHLYGDCNSVNCIIKLVSQSVYFHA